MRNLLSIGFLALISLGLFAQAPKKIGYQAVIRNQNSTLLVDKNVGVKISICLDSVNGTPVYVETHAAKTNGNGLMNLKIGDGIPVLGVMDGVDFSTGNYFIKVEVDPTGGSNYSLNSSNELMSVPYALHAESSEKCQDFQNSVVASITAADTAKWNSQVNSTKHSEGELWGGGLVIKTWANGAHGIIISLNDLSDSIQWGVVGTDIVNCENMVNGQPNTKAIVATLGAGTNYAAGLCAAYNAGGYSDWYLPSIKEFYDMADNIVMIDAVLTYDADSNTNPPFITGKGYWTSTEATVWNSGSQDSAASSYDYMQYSYQDPNRQTKDFYLRVRAFRRF